MPKRFYEIFRAGNYPQGSFDAEDIKEIAENYDPSFLEAPVTIDHSFGGRAYGWIEELKAEGERLLATFKDVSDHLKCMVATKAYKRHSVELYNDIDGKGPYLKALSMLGASTPQVKGMETIQFSEEDYPEGDSNTIEFDEPIEPGDMEFSEFVKAWLEVMGLDVEEFRQKAGLPEDVMAGLVEGRFNEEVDDETLAKFGDLMEQFQGEEISDEFAEKVMSLFTHEFISEQGFSFTADDLEDNDEPRSFEDTEEYQEMQNRIQKLEDELESEKTEKEDFRSKTEQMKFDQRKQDFVSFLDKNIKDKPKLPPKLKDKAVSLFSHLDGLDAGDEDDASPLELFKEIIEGLPEIDLDEQAPKNKQPKEFTGSKDLAEAATEYMQKQKELGNHVSAAQAVTHVKNKRSKT